MRETLLEKAKAAPDRLTGKRLSEEEVELLLAILNGEITYNQFALATGKTRNNTTSMIGFWTTRAIRDGQISVTRTGGK